MNDTSKTSRALTALAFVGFIAATAVAQDEPEQPPRPSEQLLQDDAQQEIAELFAEVERNLKRIDEMLFDAAAGEIPFGQPEESGLADLLRQTQSSSQEAVSGIDRILEISQSMKSSSQSSSGQPDSPPESGDSPLDQPRDQSPQAEEQTPEMPQPSEPKPSGSKPEDGGEDQPKESENSEGDPTNPTEPGTPVGVDQDGERWGELPPRVREVFRSQGGGDLPTQYRDWIDSYYRRLNKRP